ncbi:hypothetical protein [Neisseria dumasiana]|uniref:DNA-binding protein n=1 Tax=Neisseria dumasiana TaxID=1931275 RepID=A0ABX3WMY5_9NEIS|nr:hypothetical protein [Neisseria dumasiana]OSI36116.1 hypothetical protein BV913_02870 [Neisseria dumasiana]UOO83517.1 hypothetical protein LVJ88_07290 [Neisseria dumasiana]
MISVELSKPRNVRQAVWDILRGNRNRFLTVNQVAEKAGVPFQTANGYMYKLFKGGFIKASKGSRFRNSSAYALKDQAIVRAAPHLNKDGSTGKGSVTEALWRSIKILNRFGLDSLHTHVNMTHRVGKAHVKQYLTALTQAGYLRQAANLEYLLIKNTGAEAPQLLAVTEIYDPNLDKITLREVPDYE